MKNLFPSLAVIEYVQHPVVFQTEVFHYPSAAWMMFDNKRTIEVNSKDFKKRWAIEKIKHRDTNAVNLLGHIFDITKNYVRISDDRRSIEADPVKTKDLKPYELEMLKASLNCMNAVENPNRDTNFSKIVKKSVNTANRNLYHFNQ